MWMRNSGSPPNAETPPRETQTSGPKLMNKFLRSSSVCLSIRVRSAFEILNDCSAETSLFVRCVFLDLQTCVDTNEAMSVEANTIAIPIQHSISILEFKTVLTLFAKFSYCPSPF